MRVKLFTSVSVREFSVTLSCYPVCHCAYNTLHFFVECHFYLALGNATIWILRQVMRTWLGLFILALWPFQ